MRKGFLLREGKGRKRKSTEGQDIAEDSTAFIQWIQFVFRWTWETKLKMM